METATYLPIQGNGIAIFVAWKTALMDDAVLYDLHRIDDQKPADDTGVLVWQATGEAPARQQDGGEAVPADDRDNVRHERTLSVAKCSSM